ncbi:MAG: apolipoprotein N-acyltransferase [Chitinophagaceae bacterium]|nr:MAG: apolipoprotein N-acyltransferase [Chitinophagaceae bacterium]
MLWIEDRVSNWKKLLGLTYINMLLWNVLTTWWIWYASIPGAISAFLANSLLMCIPWLLMHFTKKKFGRWIGYSSLILFWLTFEYIHLHDWGLSWPWLTLGNVFATHTEWVQWYEYTGASGGSFWILLSNLIVYSILSEYNDSGRSWKYFVYMLIWILILVVPSVLFNQKNTNPNYIIPESNIVIVQPDIDPYEKITTGTFEAQLQKLIHLSESAIDSNTALVIWPETALYMENGIDEENMKENFFLNPLWAFLQRRPNTLLFSGVESYRMYEGKKTSTAREIPGGNYYFDAFNGSVLLDSSGPIGYYHKSMLVPGVETLPGFLKFMGKLFEKFGGTSGGYTKQHDRTPLKNNKNDIVIAPAICYESIYGEFMSKYISNGANLICIITNDGWWKKTPGYRQHMNYARLRAIETRKWIARSANTGISCFIDPLGQVHDPQPWDTASAIKMNVPTNNGQTFFVKHGDVLSKTATVVSILLLVLNIGNWARKRFLKNK